MTFSSFDLKCFCISLVRSGVVISLEEGCWVLLCSCASSLSIFSANMKLVAGCQQNILLGDKNYLKQIQSVLVKLINNISPTLATPDISVIPYETV